MKLRLLALAALAALSFNATAGLTSFAPWDTRYQANGLAGVQFSVVTAANGARVAMGAHPYTSGVTMPNNGVDTFYARAGRTDATHANWSFDYAVDYNGCTDCSTQLFVDVDPTAAINFRQLPTYGGIPDSGNMEFSYMAGPFGLSYDFDPFSASSTAFSLRMFDANGAQIANSDISVNVPEPGSLGMLALGLFGMGAMIRRRAKR